MKNGVSIAAVSELVNEIKEDTRQGIFGYAAQAEWVGGDYVQASVAPALIGSVKSPRTFSWRVSLSKDQRASKTCTSEFVYAPEELALTGLGACALLTMVKGATTCGSILEFLQFKVKANHYLSPNKDPYLGSYLADFDYGIDFNADASGSSDMFLEIVKKLSHHSPNHRTVVEGNAIRVVRPYIDEVKAISAKEDLKVVQGFNIELNWDYGFQLRACYPDNIRQTQVDQPKQGGGIDKGANPQEYLLAAFTSCLLRTFISLASIEGKTAIGAKVEANGYVDMRGLFGLSADVPTKLQYITVKFAVDSEMSESAVQRLIKQAFDLSPIARLIVEAQAIYIRFHRSGDLISEFWSKD